MSPRTQFFPSFCPVIFNDRWVLTPAPVPGSISRQGNVQKKRWDYVSSYTSRSLSTDFPLVAKIRLFVPVPGKRDGTAMTDSELEVPEAIWYC